MTAPTFLVYAVDPQGERHLVEQTASARIARQARDQADTTWIHMIVVGDDDELTISELDRYADGE